EDPAKRRQRNGDRCIDCHMTRLRKTDIVHTATTDHRILRKPAGAAPTLPAPFLLPSPLVCFPRRQSGEEEAKRDEGIALARAAQNKPMYQRYLPRAEELLEKASARDPEDLRAVSQWIAVLGPSKQYVRALAVA